MSILYLIMLKNVIINWISETIASVIQFIKYHTLNIYFISSVFFQAVHAPTLFISTLKELFYGFTIF